LKISRIAKRTLLAIREPFDIHGQIISVGVSIGIAIPPKNATNQTERLRHAGLSMYNAKQSGRKKFVFFCDLSTERSDSLNMDAPSEPQSS
jgi:GGDEF domain-containing protein